MDRRLVAVLAGLGLLALFVAFFKVGSASWLSDELYYRDAAHRYMHGDFSVNRENTMLAKYILGAFQLGLGDGHTATRLPRGGGRASHGGCAPAARQADGRDLGWGDRVRALDAPSRAEIVGNWQVGRIQIERYFRLDVFMALFVVLALLAAWRWAEDGRWRWATAAGVFAGLAAASKAPGVLILPALALVGLFSLPFDRRTLAQVAAVCGLPFVVVAISYLPLGTDAFDAIDGMFYVDKLRRTVFDTPFVFHGHLYSRPPWWANLWWQWKSLGTPATVSVAACVALAPFLLPRRALLLLGLAIGVPLLVYIVRLNYTLPYYYYAWQPQLMLLCALVLWTLLRREGFARLAAVAIAVPLIAAAGGTVRDVANARDHDFREAANELGPRLRSGAIVAWGLEAGNIIRSELPGSTVVQTTDSTPNISGIIVDPTISTRRPSPAITAYLREHRDELELRRIDRLRIYLPRGRAAAGGD